jgi:hypothetical protein
MKAKRKLKVLSANWRTQIPPPPPNAEGVTFEGEKPIWICN